MQKVENLVNQQLYFLKYWNKVILKKLADTPDLLFSKDLHKLFGPFQSTVMAL